MIDYDLLNNAKVDDIITLDSGTNLLVTRGSCIDCYFYSFSNKHCRQIHCAEYEDTTRKNIIFKEIK